MNAIEYLLVINDVTWSTRTICRWKGSVWLLNNDKEKEKKYLFHSLRVF